MGTCRHGHSVYSSCDPPCPRCADIDEVVSRVSASTLYLMLIDGRRHWLPIAEAGRAYDNGFCRIEIGGLAIDGSGPERAVRGEEFIAIRDAADAYSEGK